MMNSGIHHTAILQPSSPLHKSTIAMAQRTCMLTGLQNNKTSELTQHLINKYK